MLLVAEPTLDTRIIQECLSGDVERYGALVDRYSARTINLAYMMIGDQHHAEDIAQEAFVRAYRGLSRFQRKAKFSSWLYQITLNLCKDHLKAKSRHARSLEDEHLDSLDSGPREQAPRIILEEELNERMRQIIHELPYVYREAFVLRHLQDLDYDEIAGITGVPADTARVRAYRAREMIREKIASVVDTFWREKAAKAKDRGEPST